MALKRLKSPPPSGKVAPRSRPSDPQTASNAARKGSFFIKLIQTAKTERKLTTKELCDKLKITEDYWSKLQTGVKEISNLGPDTLRRAAQLLNIDYVSAQLLVGQLHPTDFYPDRSEIDIRLPKAIDWIRTDPKYIGFAPDNIDKLPCDTQLFIVMVYEDATGHRLMPTRMTPQKILQRFEELTTGE